MRNQTNNVFKVKRQKSKVFLTILCMLGLVFSYSCSCKNRVSNPDDTPTDGGVTPPPGTFSISEATNNVTTNFVVKTTNTVGEIKIGFVSANNYPYTLSYEVVDTNENNQILKSDTDYANDVLTIKKTGLDKIRAIPSVDAPAVRTITINFTFTADDKTLNNYTQTLSVEVKLTHAQKLDDNNKNEVITKIINKINRKHSFKWTNPDNLIDVKFATFDLSKGKYENDVYLISNSTTDTKMTTFVATDIQEINIYLQNFLPALDEISGVTKGKEAGTVGTDNYYEVTYNISWSENFETTINSIKFRYEL